MEFIGLNMRYFNLLLLLMLFEFYGQSQAVVKLDSTYLYSSNGERVLIRDSIIFDSTDKYIVIYNSVNCKGCVDKISLSLDSINKKDSLSKIYIFTTAKGLKKYQLSYESESILERINNVNSVFFDPIIQDGLFDIKYSDSGVFKQFNIEITPCVIVYKKGKIIYYPYQELFPSKNSYNDSWCKD